MTNLFFIISLLGAFLISSSTRSDAREPIDQNSLNSLTTEHKKSAENEGDSSFLNKLKIDDKTTFSSFVNLPEEKLLISIANIEGLENILMKKLYLFQNTLLFRVDNKEISIGFGYDANEFIEKFNKIKQSRAKSSHLFPQLFFTNAFANFTVNCLYPNSRSDIESLRNKLQIAIFGESIKECNFSVDHIIDLKLEESKKILKEAEKFNLSEFINHIKISFSKLLELIPKIDQSLIEPLKKIYNEAPSLANKIICQFTEQKIGDAFQSVITGGAGVLRTVPKTADEIIDISKLVQRISNNSTIKKYLLTLHDQKKLTPDLMNALLDVTDDIPAEIKRNIRSFWGGANRRNHYQKHKDEFSSKSSEDYVSSAKTFAKNIDKNNISYRQPNGDTVKWNTRTDEYIVISTHGNIVTYFKLNCIKPEEKLLHFLSISNFRCSYKQ